MVHSCLASGWLSFDFGVVGRFDYERYCSVHDAYWRYSLESDISDDFIIHTGEDSAGVFYSHFDHTKYTVGMFFWAFDNLNVAYIFVESWNHFLRDFVDFVKTA